MSSIAPKKPLTAYNLFTRDAHKKMKEEDPHQYNFKDASKHVSELWMTINDKEKEKYQRLAETDKARYADDLKNYTPPEANNVETRSQKPKSPYNFYMTEVKDDYKKSNPTLSLSQVNKLISEKWKSMSDDEKSAYVNKSKNDKTRYKKEAKKNKPTDSPKKPLSSYMFYCRDVRTNCKMNNEKSPSSKELGLKWNERSDEDKEKYEKLALDDKKRYADDIEKYKAKVSNDE